MKAQMESWQDIQEYVKNNKKKHKRRMANDAMKNVNELGFPFTYFEDTYLVYALAHSLSVNK